MCRRDVDSRFERLSGGTWGEELGFDAPIPLVVCWTLLYKRSVDDGGIWEVLEPCSQWMVPEDETFDPFNRGTQVLTALGAERDSVTQFSLYIW